MLGTVLEINDTVVDSPDLVNASPFDDGWLIKITLSGDLPALLSRDEYVALTAE